MIKAKDPRLHQINIVVPGFLTGPSPKGTHQVELPSQHSVKEEATPLQLVREEVVGVVEFSDFEEDFKASDQPSPSDSLGALFSHLPSVQVSST